MIKTQDKMYYLMIYINGKLHVYLKRIWFKNILGI